MGGQRSVLSCRKKWINKALRIAKPENCPSPSSGHRAAQPALRALRAPAMEGAAVLQGKPKDDSKAEALQIPVRNKACIFKWGWLTAGTAHYGKWWICHLWMSSKRGWMLPGSPSPKPSPGLDVTFPGTAIATVHLTAPKKPPLGCGGAPDYSIHKCIMIRGRFLIESH